MRNWRYTAKQFYYLPTLLCYIISFNCNKLKLAYAVKIKNNGVFDDEDECNVMS